MVQPRLIPYTYIDVCGQRFDDSLHEDNMDPSLCSLQPRTVNNNNYNNVDLPLENNNAIRTMSIKEEARNNGDRGRMQSTQDPVYYRYYTL